MVSCSDRIILDIADKYIALELPVLSTVHAHEGDASKEMIDWRKWPGKEYYSPRSFFFLFLST